MSEIIKKYTQKYKKSEQLFTKGGGIIAGSGHESRPQKPFPIFVENAKGSIKFDVDGNRIIDYQMGFGSLILGHSHPAVMEKVAKRLEQGTHLGALSELELIWGSKVKNLIPSAELVRFTASGSESTLLAMRLARAFTGKKKIIKFKQHYHGWHDYAVPESGLNTDFGVPEETTGTITVLEPEIKILSKYLEDNTDVAGVIFEATGAHWGQLPLKNPEFMQNLRDLTTKHNIVMIMDEVICGFRVSKGGAQKKYGVLPDLTTMAKIVAGGLPGGAVAGKEEIMSLLNEGTHYKNMYHPGTFNGNPVSATAGIEALNIISNEPINEKADANADKLRIGLKEVLDKMEVKGHVHGISSIVHIALGVEGEYLNGISQVPHSELFEATSGNLPRMIKLAFLNEGIDIMGGIGFMLSSEHTDDDINQTLYGFQNVLSALRSDRII